MDAAELGRFLRESREAKELTLDDAEQALRIRAHILQSFEEGNFDIPDAVPVQIRGFIRNYARYLDLDEERILEYYEATFVGKQAKGFKGRKLRRDVEKMPAPQAARDVSDTDPALPVVPPSVRASQEMRVQRRRSALTTLLILIVGTVALIFVGFAIATFIQPPGEEPIFGGGDDDLPPQVLSTLPAAPTLTRAPTLTPFAIPTPLPGIQQDFTGEGVVVTIEFTQRSWVRVAADGIEQLVGIVRPGEVHEFRARDEIVMTAANAAALDVIYNGRSQGTFGRRGQMVEVVFTQSGVNISSNSGFEPTAENTATPLPTTAVSVGTIVQQLTISPTPSITLTHTPGPSPTPSDTLTPSNTPTITLTPSVTPIPSATPSVTPIPTLTFTPGPTLTPSRTLTPSITPSATVVLPPRIPAGTLPVTKEG
ncbi:MAG: DUF4115 domain-containing protein [Chloroflexi bacterium]|nr:MAG: DUF4115 domain-containing protein [Chloroflexota bacterium]